jgi:hypothetical protein
MTGNAKIRLQLTNKPYTTLEEQCYQLHMAIAEMQQLEALLETDLIIQKMKV